MRNNDIKTMYHDALYFSTASFNTKESFALTPVQKDVLIKLIHYSTKNEVITWSSQNIHYHTCIPVGSIDKAIQRLRQKGYINVQNKQISSRYVSREITINWVLIEEIDLMYKEWFEKQTIQPSEEFIQENEIEAVIESFQPEVVADIKVEEKYYEEENIAIINHLIKQYQLDFEEASIIEDMIIEQYDQSTFTKEELKEIDLFITRKLQAA
jgi:hypothetical protein